MRTFITRDMLCNDDDIVPGVEKCESGLKARYACSESRKKYQYKLFLTRGRWLEFKVDTIFTLGLLRAWLWGLGVAFCKGSLSGLRRMQNFKAMGDIYLY